MKWRALATDFDGTIAVDGVVTESTIKALQRARGEGLAVLLVTGRELIDFEKGSFDLGIFDLVVAENGATLFDPKAGKETRLTPPPSEEFVAALQAKQVPLSVGKAIVATVQPYEIAVFETIRDMKLELGVTFNKGAVMVLPPNVNKASGLVTALAQLNIEPTETIAVGDGENDHAFFDACGFPVAVANAVPALKERAKHVTNGNAGSGMEELVAWLFDGPNKESNT